MSDLDTSRGQLTELGIRVRTFKLVLGGVIGRIPCGAFGGAMPDGRTRWCLKPLGHSDSCAFDWGDQPLSVERARARGWR
jgi:hypothetical protein